MPSWTENRRKARARKFEEGPPPIASTGRPVEQVRCAKCGSLLAQAEHFRRATVVILPPGVPAPSPPPPDSVLVLRCQKCHERRAAIVDLPAYPWATQNGNGKKP